MMVNFERDVKLRVLPKVKTFALTNDTSCGVWCVRGKFLQKFANKTAFAILFGVVTTLHAATYSYYSNSITTLEKRFSIPSNITSMIYASSDITQVILAFILGYYVDTVHRPRLIAFGTLCVAFSCFLNASPYFIYGAGADAEALTYEFGNFSNQTLKNIAEEYPLVGHSQEEPCSSNNFIWPQVILLLAQLFSGVGVSFFGIVGPSYIDDNTQQSKTPWIMSVHYLFRELSPSLGFGISTLSLSQYVNPLLTPVILPEDPRWIGAWWIGWLVLGVLSIIAGSIIALFPRELPEAARRKQNTTEEKVLGIPPPKMTRRSTADLRGSFVRLIKNPVIMFHFASNIFLYSGYASSFSYFLSRYLENIYNIKKTTAATVVLGPLFSAIGLLVSGYVITRYKPSARLLSEWNVISSAIIVCGLLSLLFIGCAPNEIQNPELDTEVKLEQYDACVKNCRCNFFKYSPVCHRLTNKTYKSPCHASCTGYNIKFKEHATYTNFACLNANVSNSHLKKTPYQKHATQLEGLDIVEDGKCPVDCTYQYRVFVAMLCLLKFTYGSQKTSSFLVSVRSVEKRDKSVFFGLGIILYAALAFIPSPFIVGEIVDSTCIVRNETCGRKGNCWLYDNIQFKNRLAFTTGGLVFISFLSNIGVWFNSKELNIFDDEEIPLSPKEVATVKQKNKSCFSENCFDSQISLV